jgi:hypothetical protein
MHTFACKHEKMEQYRNAFVVLSIHCSSETSRRMNTMHKVVFLIYQAIQQLFHTELIFNKLDHVCVEPDTRGAEIR